MEFLLKTAFLSKMGIFIVQSLYCVAFISTYTVLAQNINKLISLNISLTLCIFQHSQKYMYSTQRLSLNKKSMLNDFTYKQVSCNVNFTIYASLIFNKLITN